MNISNIMSKSRAVTVFKKLINCVKKILLAGFEPAISCCQGKHLNHLTTEASGNRYGFKLCIISHNCALNGA